MRLKDRVAVVTGAHRGIGFAIADALAREGASVLAADIIAKRPEFVGNSVDYMAMDVSLPSDWDDVEARLRRKLGCLDILVNAAGITSGTAAVHEVALEDWDRNHRRQPDGRNAGHAHGHPHDARARRLDR